MNYSIWTISQRLLKSSLALVQKPNVLECELGAVPVALLLDTSLLAGLPYSVIVHVIVSPSEVRLLALQSLPLGWGLAGPA